MENKAPSIATPSEATVFISTEAPLILTFGGTVWEVSFSGEADVSLASDAAIAYLTDRRATGGLRLLNANIVGASHANHITSFTEMARSVNFAKAVVLSYVGFNFKHDGNQPTISIRDVVVALMRR